VGPGGRRPGGRLHPRLRPSPRAFFSHSPDHAAPRPSRERRARELLRAAEEAVAPRRDPALDRIPAAPAKPGVYVWGDGTEGGVRAGAKVWFAYNCGAGPLAYTNKAKLHLGVDNWKNKAKTVRGGAWGVGFRGSDDRPPLRPQKLGRGRGGVPIKTPLRRPRSCRTHQVHELPQLKGREVQELGLPPGSWCGAQIEVPKAQLLDFVISDA
jgi:hypothetical protein